MTASEMWELQEAVLGLAAVVDLLLTAGGLAAWRKATAGWWVQLNTATFPSSAEVVDVFRRAFEIIFGPAALSARRLAASTISGLVIASVVRVAYLHATAATDAWYEFDDGSAPLPLLPFLRPEPGRHSIMGPVLWSFFLLKAVAFNTVADYVSLWQTHWVLKRGSSGRGKLPGLVALDLALSTAVTLAVLGVTTGITYLYDPQSLENMPPAIRYEYAPMLISTYLTSVLWWMGLLAVGLVRLARGFAPRLARVIESKPVQNLPITLLAGGACLLSWPLWLAWELVAG